MCEKITPHLLNLINADQQAIINLFKEPVPCRSHRQPVMTYPDAMRLVRMVTERLERIPARDWTAGVLVHTKDEHVMKCVLGHLGIRDPQDIYTPIGETARLLARIVIHIIFDDEKPRGDIGGALFIFNDARYDRMPEPVARMVRRHLGARCAKTRVIRMLELVYRRLDYRLSNASGYAHMRHQNPRPLLVPPLPERQAQPTSLKFTVSLSADG